MVLRGPTSRRGTREPQIYRIARNNLMQIRKKWLRPRFLRLEAALACQLRCPSCPTGTGDIHKTLGKGFLKKDDFEKLLTSNRHLKKIELANYGEVLLNPQMLDILEIAHKHGVSVDIGTGANMNTVRPEVLEGVVKYGLRSITCSVDGTTQDSYQTYRIRGNLSRVLANIRKINEFKKKYKAVFPRLCWQFVVFGHNEKQITEAKRMARDLKMSFYPKLSWDSEFSPIRDRAAVMRDTGLHATDRENYTETSEGIYLEKICDQLWEAPQINFDGKMLGCCINYWQDFGGNAFDDLPAAVNSEKMAYAREMLQGKAPPRDDIPCTTCHLYRDRQQKARWVNPRSPKRLAMRWARLAKCYAEDAVFSASMMLGRLSAF